METTNYKVKEKSGKIFTFLKRVFKNFKKKPEILNLGTEEMEDQAIFIANHSGASGPFTYELFFPKYFIPWGTHEMCGNYKMRWNYLYNVFYRQKLKYSKFKSFLLATTFGLISKLIYNATGLIGTYKDIRLIKTFKQSFKVLDKNHAILIFPEDSSTGYFEKPKSYFQGYLSLAKMYYKHSKIDLPIYNVYYSKKSNKLIIDKPIKVNDMLKKGMSEDQITSNFLTRAYEMYDKYIAKDIKKEV